MKKFTLFLFITACSFHCCAQTYTGQVFDSKSKHPIAFVSIGIPSQGVGTNTDEDGKYTLLLDSELENDTLQFSIIGYKNVSISIRNYEMNYPVSNAAFLLEENIYPLSEITIRPKHVITEITGNIFSDMKQKDCASVFDLFDVAVQNAEEKIDARDKYHTAFPEKHIEVGTLFEIKKRETFIDKVQLQFCASGYDSLKLRLNIYSHLKRNRVKGVMILYPVYESVLKTPIYFTINKNGGLVDIDLASYNIMVTDDFIISVETLNPLDNTKIHFVAEKALSGDPTVASISYQKPWMKVPLMKLGCNVTLSYENKGNWFTNIFY